MKKSLAIAAYLSLVALVSHAGIAHAADAQVGDICTGDALANLFCSTSIPDMLNSMFQLAIAVGGILAMLRISWAGWQYMGAGFDNWGSKEKAKKTFQDAVIGLLILLAIWLILTQINPNILKLNLVQDMNLPAGQNSTPSPPAPVQQTNIGGGSG